MSYAGRSKTDYQPGEQFRVICSAPPSGQHQFHNYNRADEKQIDFLLATLPKKGFNAECLPWVVEIRTTGPWLTRGEVT